MALSWSSSSLLVAFVLACSMWAQQCQGREMLQTAEIDSKRRKDKDDKDRKDKDDKDKRRFPKPFCRYHILEEGLPVEIPAVGPPGAKYTATAMCYPGEKLISGGCYVRVKGPDGGPPTTSPYEGLKLISDYPKRIDYYKYEWVCEYVKDGPGGNEVDDSQFPGFPGGSPSSQPPPPQKPVEIIAYIFCCSDKRPRPSPRPWPPGPPGPPGPPPPFPAPGP